jgi:hypothetical protein
MNYVSVLKAAFEQKVASEQPLGCCRVYVSVDKAHAKGVAAACKKLNLIFQKKSHYGASNAVYVGYDNCDGKALAKGSAVVAALKAAGVDCYRDEQGD